MTAHSRAVTQCHSHRFNRVERTPSPDGGWHKVLSTLNTLFCLPARIHYCPGRFNSSSSWYNKERGKTSFRFVHALHVNKLQRVSHHLTHCSTSIGLVTTPTPLSIHQQSLVKTELVTDGHHQKLTTRGRVSSSEDLHIVSYGPIRSYE